MASRVISLGFVDAACQSDGSIELRYQHLLDPIVLPSDIRYVMLASVARPAWVGAQTLKEGCWL